MGHRSSSKSIEHKDSYKKSTQNFSTTNKYINKDKYTSRNRDKYNHRSRSRSRDKRSRIVDREYRHNKHKHSRRDKYNHKSRYRSESRSESYHSDNSKLKNISTVEPVVNSDLREEFEKSAFDRAYGLDISGFVGISSEILGATSVSEETRLTRTERRKHREHELKHHQERFWKCKRCEFMNYLSNYECKRCKALRASASQH
ncbi:uncharacterized protein TA18850 [Theileria annulata]|uniref:RanBP2-type domain-containing protein n=1 Tax=Theileria annulata TaxID=5874 RepID=Q4UBB8_THEAN|nr:uncharacterized protein TA18850 [Theileria annulata]CAI75883.1 hypothetical protein TA18850 [Theileria annulata]|eukprot:XP_955359.1 hypothetical protein TA18850 [Theileria annulata]